MVENITNMKLCIINVFRSNYLAEFHVRELAKLLNKSHVTLLPHLKSFEKEHILVSKKMGKNKVFALNFDDIVTKNFLVLAETAEAIAYLEGLFLVKKILAEILKLNLAGSLVLFGSYAKRTQNEQSDIDLFYLGSLTQTKINVIKNIGKVYGKIINIKIAKLDNFENALRKKDTLIKEIVKNHVILQNAELFVSALWRYYSEIKQ